MANIEIKDIEMSENGEDSNINSAILKYYTRNPDTYLKLEVSNPVTASCKSIALVSNSVNFLMYNMKITDNYCENSSPAIIINSTKTQGIDSIHSERNSGRGITGVCLSFQNMNTVISITNSEFIGNKNYLSGSPGVIEFSKISALALENCTFIMNSADSGGSLYFYGQSLLVNNCHFEHNQSPGFSGGSI
ncbi:unnamed protein product [Blepharisma stoltei]|uniref:Right handed beta helix domain-containing protein n=1 Tax=Blepharisma stoltei TaxID=1481888 RepID=A0AAU9JEZ9_9CILI|nr:unnamed protein product [Blepharisma stoltei]